MKQNSTTAFTAAPKQADSGFSCALNSKQLARLKQSGYFLVGPSRHSAVKVCLWCKKSLCEQGHCYKQEFYGIESHRCLQFTPSLPFCSHKCVFCWRDTSITFPKWIGPIDGPKEIVDAAIEAQRLLLTGFKGNSKADLKKWKEAQTPAHAAISLSGEPCIYPRLGDLISEFHSRNMTTFLVTNGLYPSVLEQMAQENQLPTQLYVSLASHDKESYEKIHSPLMQKGWEKFNETLKLLPAIGKKTRTVIRMTLAKKLNLAHAKEYAKLILKSQADYVEVKAYMALGSSRLRLTVDAMPLHEEIEEFAAQLSQETGYLESAKHAPSRIVLLSKDENAEKNRKIKFKSF